MPELAENLSNILHLDAGLLVLPAAMETAPFEAAPGLGQRRFLDLDRIGLIDHLSAVHDGQGDLRACVVNLPVADAHLTLEVGERCRRQAQRLAKMIVAVERDPSEDGVVCFSHGSVVIRKDTNRPTRGQRARAQA